MFPIPDLLHKVCTICGRWGIYMVREDSNDVPYEPANTIMAKALPWMHVDVRSNLISHLGEVVVSCRSEEELQARLADVRQMPRGHGMTLRVVAAGPDGVIVYNDAV